MSKTIDIPATLIAKIHPRRAPGMSGKMVALVGFIVGEILVETPIAELVVTSDGMLLARNSNDCGCNAIIGTMDEFKRNWDNWLDAVEASSTGLTAEERKIANAAFDASYTDFRHIESKS